VKKFNRKLLGDTGIEKVARAKSEQGFVQPDRKVGRLDTYRRKALKEKGN